MAEQHSLLNCRSHNRKIRSNSQNRLETSLKLSILTDLSDGIFHGRQRENPRRQHKHSVDNHKTSARSFYAPFTTNLSSGLLARSRSNVIPRTNFSMETNFGSGGIATRTDWPSASHGCQSVFGYRAGQPAIVSIKKRPRQLLAVGVSSFETFLEVHST